MRILIVSPWLPYPPTWGFGMRVYQLARHLARVEDVTLLAYARDGGVPAPSGARFQVLSVPPPAISSRRRLQLGSLLSVQPFQVRELRSDQMQSALDRLSEKVDLVQVESSQMAGFSWGSAVGVLDEHNLEYELLRRVGAGERSLIRKAYNWAEHAKVRRHEQAAWTTFDGCLLTSEREAVVVRARAPRLPVAVVPNGVDLDHFRPPAESGAGASLLFTGLLTYRPNLDAALHLVRDIFPRIRRSRPDATLTIVGHGLVEDLTRLAAPGVSITGWVPDVRPYLARAAVSLAPLRMGGGTRLKILEAMAMGRPVVSTSIGSEGLEVQEGQHLRIADNPQAFAEEVVWLLGQPVAAREMGLQARRLVEARYGWAAIADRLQAFHLDLLRGRAAVPATISQTSWEGPE